MICEDFDDNAALLDAFLRVDYLFRATYLAIFVFAQEDETFAVATRRDKHHVNHIVLKRLMMRDFLEVLVVGLRSILVVSLRKLNEMIDQVRRRLDLLVFVCRGCCLRIVCVARFLLCVSCPFVRVWSMGAVTA